MENGMEWRVEWKRKGSRRELVIGKIGEEERVG